MTPTQLTIHGNIYNAPPGVALPERERRAWEKLCALTPALRESASQAAWNLVRGGMNATESLIEGIRRAEECEKLKLILHGGLPDSIQYGKPGERKKA